MSNPLKICKYLMEATCGGIFQMLFLCLLWMSNIWIAKAESGAASNHVRMVAVYEVAKGKLHVRYEDNQTAFEQLVKMYGDSRLASAFTNRVLQEINISLESLNPLIEWKVPVDGSSTLNSSRSLVDSENITAASDYNGTLKAWLETFLKSPADFAGQFFQWHPTRTSQLSDDTEVDKSIIDLDAIGFVLRDSMANLIAKIQPDEVSATDYRTGKLKIWFIQSRPVTKVTIAGMDWPQTEGLENLKPAGYDSEKEHLEVELTRSITSGGLAMAWNDDLAVQRLMTVIRARGMWEGIAQNGLLTRPGAVYWLTFDSNESEAKVYLPHLSHIIFQGAANTRPVIEAVTRELLSKDEHHVVCDSLRENEIEGTNSALKHIISSQNAEITQGRFVDLFALASYRTGTNASYMLQTNKNGSVITNKIILPPAPVKQEWLEPRLNKIRDMGWRVSASQSLKDENRLVRSNNRRRRELLHGGMDIVISPVVATTNAQVPGTNDPAFKEWIFDKVHYQVEAGAKWEDSQRVNWLTRFSAADIQTFGRLDTELNFQYRVSAKLNWEPPEPESSSLPSFMSVFTEADPKRGVNGRDIEIERKGLRVGERVPFDSLNWKSVLNGAVELANVEDNAGYISGADELRAPFTFSLYSEPSVWDARRHWHILLNATPSARWRSDTDFFVTLGASVQVRYPNSFFDFVSKLDLKGAVGPTPLDALPYLGGSGGVRGVRPYGVSARECIISRNELWWQIPLIGRSTGSDQKFYALAYENLRLASFIDIGWASGIHESGPTSAWFASPGVGLRLILVRNTYLALDYAYGICRPFDLGGHRISLGITTTQF